METTSLWELLLESSFSLHMPRFALFLFMALILEITYSKRKVCPMCSASTVILQLVTGVSGIIAAYYLSTSYFYEGDRIRIPVWYYPVVGLFLFSVSLLFVWGTKSLLRNRMISNLIIRSIVFGVTVYFAFVTAITPTIINKNLEKWEKAKQNQSSEPMCTMPVE